LTPVWWEASWACRAVGDEHAGEDAGLQHDRQRRGDAAVGQRARREAGNEAGHPGGDAKRHPGLARGLGIDLGEQRLHRARRRRSQRLVEADRLAQLLANEFVAGGKRVVVGERGLDAGGVAARQRAGGMPRQEEFDILRKLGGFPVHRVHGQPLSIP
jgi:hypothetical protein